MSRSISRRSFLKAAGVGAAALGLAACGGSSSSSTAASAPASSAAASAASGSGKPYEGVVLHYAATDTEATGNEMQDIVKMVKEKTGIDIQFTIIPKADVGEVDKRLVSLQAGDDLDIIYGTTAQLKVFYDAGVLSPLDEYAAAASHDAPAVFGGSIPYYDDGQMYGLPAFNDVWCTFVNTKVFENAGVEVPSAEGWTWEKYVETAKKLTDINNEIYGSLMLDYDCYNYMYALQKGAEHYKADGTSNYDDMRNAGYTDVERGERGSTEEHLTVTQFKVQREQERLDSLTSQIDQKEQSLAQTNTVLSKKERELAAVQKKATLTKEALIHARDLDYIGKRTFLGNYSLTEEEFSKLKKQADHGYMMDVENRRLKEELSTAKKEAAHWGQKYHELWYEVKPYLDALHRAPELVRDFLEKILAPKQERTMDAPQQNRKRGQDMEL